MQHLNHRYLSWGLEVELLTSGGSHNSFHEGPEVLGVATERAVCEQASGPLPRGVRHVAVGRVYRHGAGSCWLVPEHAAERSWNADAATDVAPESNHRAGRSDLHRKNTREKQYSIRVSISRYDYCSVRTTSISKQYLTIENN